MTRAQGLKTKVVSRRKESNHRVVEDMTRCVVVRQCIEQSPRFCSLGEDRRRLADVLATFVAE